MSFTSYTRTSLIVNVHSGGVHGADHHLTVKYYRDMEVHSRRTHVWTYHIVLEGSLLRKLLPRAKRGSIAL